MKKEEIIFTIPRLYSNLKELYIEHNTVCLGRHFHTAIEVVFVKSGSVLCNFEDKSIRIMQNQIIIIGSNVIHHLTYDKAPAQIFYLQVDIAKIVKMIYPELADMELMLSSSLKKYALFTENTNIYGLFQNILYELKVQKPYYEIATIGGLIQLISYLQRETLVPDYEEIFKKPSFKKIYPMILYAHEHFSEKIYLDDVCNIFCIDKFYFCKQFKKISGITFFQYLNKVRLQNAEKLLTATNKSITQISLDCGFSTIQYFNSAFVKSKGCSPSSYREAYYKNSTV